MTEPRSLQTIAEIQAQLDQTLQKIDELEQRRAEVLDEIKRIDKQMYVLAFHRAPSAPRKRFANKKTLKQLIPPILKRHWPGLTLDELTEKIRETGYQTSAKSLRMVVYQAVYRSPSVEFDKENRCYRIKKKATQ